MAIAVEAKLSPESPRAELLSFVESVNEMQNPTTDQLLAQANAYRWLKDYKSAIKTLDRLTALRPTNGALHAFRGIMLKFDDRFKEAKAELDTAEKLGYTRTSVYAERSAVLMSLSDYSSALKDANKAVEAEPGNANFHVLVGWAKGELGKPEDGLAALDKALQLDANNAGALGIRAAIYKKIGRSKEASTDWQRAHSLGWKSPL